MILFFNLADRTVNTVPRGSRNHSETPLRLLCCVMSFIIIWSADAAVVSAAAAEDATAGGTASFVAATEVAAGDAFAGDASTGSTGRTVSSVAGTEAAAGDTSSGSTADAASAAGTAETSEEIETALIEGWPEAPSINAEAAVVMEADSGAVLYSKNLHKQMYPASTTKLMTGLLAYENLDLDDMVTFSQEAVGNVDYGSTTIGLDAGESMPVSECLYALFVASANEVANGLAEKVSGTQQSFVRLMNQKARELGCEDTHFANTNGLYNEEHYTSVYDMALIAREFFSYDELAEYADTPSYHFEATSTQPDDFTVINKHKLINGEIEYEGVIGGKTGYLDAAGQTLVTVAERDGVRLICVVFKEETPDQFTDTVSLFDYGFDNFTKLRIADNETSYAIRNPGFFSQGNDIFGSNILPYTVSGTGYVMIPNSAGFADLESEVTTDQVNQYNQSDNDQSDNDQSDQDTLGTISYTYNGAFVGSAEIIFTGAVSAANNAAVARTDDNISSTAAAAEEDPHSSADDTGTAHDTSKTGIAGRISSYFGSIFHTGDNGTLYVNLPALMILIICTAAAVILIIMTVSYRSYLRRRRRRAGRRRRRK